MTVATEMFLSKIDRLSNLLSETRKALDGEMSTESREIEVELNRLKKFVEEDKCLNAGGKFEWVDSLLVKVLKKPKKKQRKKINFFSLTTSRFLTFPLS